MNIRGLNRSLKQKKVRQTVQDNKPTLCAVLESHVAMAKLIWVCRSAFNKWDWTSNGNVC